MNGRDLLAACAACLRLLVKSDPGFGTFQAGFQQQKLVSAQHKKLETIQDAETVEKKHNTALQL
jgi:hypothetical protein